MWGGVTTTKAFRSQDRKRADFYGADKKQPKWTRTSFSRNQRGESGNGERRKKEAECHPAGEG